MLHLNLSEDIMQRLREAAHKRQRSIEEIIEALVTVYLGDLLETAPPTRPLLDLNHVTAEMVADDPKLQEMFHLRGLMASGELDPLVPFIGIIEAPISDLSATVAETLDQHTDAQSGWSEPS